MHPSLAAQDLGRVADRLPHVAGGARDHGQGLHLDLGGLLPSLQDGVHGAADLEAVHGRGLKDHDLQIGWSGCRTGNGEELSNSQVCCLSQLCMATA